MVPASPRVLLSLAALTIMPSPVRAPGQPLIMTDLQGDRGATGRTVAPGVYWARAATERDPVTRVVVVR